MKIKSVHLNHLRHDGHFQFFQFLIALVQSIGTAALKVENRFNDLAALHAQEDEAFRKIAKSALTERINEADRARDEVFRSMANAIRAGLTHFTPAVREAAARLQIVMDAYGNVTKKTRVEETSALYNLTRELAGKHADDAKILNLEPWIGELERRNTAVEMLLEERADESAARTAPAMKAVRSRVDKAYRALAELVEARATIASANNDAEAMALYDDFIGRLNQRIDLLNKTLARHRKHAENNEELKIENYP